jgi:hypothetical protein
MPEPHHSRKSGHSGCMRNRASRVLKYLAVVASLTNFMTIIKLQYGPAPRPLSLL